MLNESEQNTLKKIKENKNLGKAIFLIEEFIESKISEEGESQTYKKAFDEIFQVMQESNQSVKDFLEERKNNGEIHNVSQALKSIAGNNFSCLIEYCFLKNKEIGNIKDNIYITSHKKSVPSFDEISTIIVDGETQKPDCDLVIYSLNPDGSLKRCMILSLKTSLRERAGQTYKWKLLLEIVQNAPAIREKYKIEYRTDIKPLICFSTVNFYNEINNPQQRGMFKFFDKAFIAKNIDVDNFIVHLSELPDFVNSEL